MCFAQPVRAARTACKSAGKVCARFWTASYLRRARCKHSLLYACHQQRFPSKIQDLQERLLLQTVRMCYESLPVCFLALSAWSVTLRTQTPQQQHAGPDAAAATPLCCAMCRRLNKHSTHNGPTALLPQASLCQTQVSSEPTGKPASTPCSSWALMWVSLAVTAPACRSAAATAASPPAIHSTETSHTGRPTQLAFAAKLGCFVMLCHCSCKLPGCCACIAFAATTAEPGRVHQLATRRGTTMLPGTAGKASIIHFQASGPAAVCCHFVQARQACR